MYFNKIVSKNVYTKFNVFVVMLSFLGREVYSEWNTRDYMKREHSLLKPYQGKMYFALYCSILLCQYFFLLKRIWYNRTKLGFYGFHYCDR